MVTETGFGGNNLSDTEMVASAEEGTKRHSTSRERKNRRTPTPDTTVPTPTPHVEDDLKSDASDYGDESSESSFSSHNDTSSSDGSCDEMQGPNGKVHHIHSEADIDVALLERVSLSHKSRNGQRAAELSDNHNSKSDEKMSLDPRSSEDSEEKQKSVRFSKFIDV